MWSWWQCRHCQPIDLVTMQILSPNRLDCLVHPKQYITCSGNSSQTLDSMTSSGELTTAILLVWCQRSPADSAQNMQLHQTFTSRSPCWTPPTALSSPVRLGYHNAPETSKELPISSRSPTPMLHYPGNLWGWLWNITKILHCTPNCKGTVP